ncbi:MAG: hypothetical protein Q9207_005346 [Kuettlingeria erythrocarpa]
MLRGKNCADSLLSTFGQLYQQGVLILFQSLVSHGKTLHDLPTYPWDHNASYWYESRPGIGSKSAVASGIMRICDNCEAIFTGESDTLDILMRGDLLTEIYNAVSFGHGEFLRMLSHMKPTLRILEVGAGTGGTTATILRDLVNKEGYPLYSLYTFTDISAGFFPQAKERFATASNMDYRVLDISQDPFQQGFEAESYDLILAPNVVHATPSLHETLSNLRPLLRMDGHLVLTELSAVIRTPNYIFGNFSGWWLGEADGRLDEPYISVARCDEEPKAAGFTGVDTAVYDAQEPYQYCAAIVSQPKPAVDAPSSAGQRTTLLCNDPKSPVVQALAGHMKAEGHAYAICTLDQAVPDDQNIVCTLDIESNFFGDLTEEHFRSFQHIIQKHDHWNIPNRSSELAVPLVTLEISQHQAQFAPLVMQVYEKVNRQRDAGILSPDREYAVDCGVIKIGRYHPFSLQSELGAKRSTAGGVKTLEIGKPGLMQTLHWTEKSPAMDMGSDEVEIEVKAIGLNFRDVLLAMGVLDYGIEGVPLGIEAAGVIARVGSGGVGFAAMQICLMIGAEVYVTVGSDEKAQHLMDHFPISSDRIFHSRDESFVRDVRQATHGRGVDIVLNSLSGDLLHASWKCVAEFGMMVELGKRDIVGHGMLEMDIFEANRSYCCVDIAHLIRDKPDKMGQWGAVKMHRFVPKGFVSPIRPLKAFEAPQAEEAFRSLSSGEHIGKFVLRVSDDSPITATVPRASPFVLDSDATYLLAGGLGGLGKSIAI